MVVIPIVVVIITRIAGVKVNGVVVRVDIVVAIAITVAEAEMIAGIKMTVGVMTDGVDGTINDLVSGALLVQIAPPIMTKVTMVSFKAETIGPNLIKNYFF